MKKKDFAFDQEFRDNLAGASAQQTAEGGSWADYGIALAKIVGISFAGKLIDAFILGATGAETNFGDLAQYGSIGWYVFGPGSPSSASATRKPTDVPSSPNRP